MATEAVDVVLEEVVVGDTSVSAAMYPNVMCARSMVMYPEFVGTTKRVKPMLLK